MSIQDKSKEELIKELGSLRQEVTELRANQSVLDEQKNLIENLLTMARYAAKKETSRDNLLQNWINIINSSKEESLVKKSLQQALDSAVKLTKAEKGSLFLLNSDGIVTDSILTRGETATEDRSKLIGRVLDEGLAGWVVREREIGLVYDTEQDERWLTFRDQPYTVRSALAIPILRGEKDLLAIITLLHSEPRHFSLETAKLMEITANHIAIVLEVASREIEKAAFEIQTKLLENLVEIAHSSSKIEVLKSALQTTLDIATDQTASEKGSLFVLDPDGRIVDAILARTDVTPEQSQNLIGKVLDKGLAGWVAHERKVGLIIDTENDDRWMTLPNQPYTVRSALAVPILRGENLLGIITLQHSEPGHFTQKVARLMEVTANQMSLVLENARLYSELKKYSQALDSELKKGREMQVDFLPYELPQLPNWEVATCFYPAIKLAGDFYDVFKIGDCLGLVIADVCDKGVGAALFMALFRSLIRIFSTQETLIGQEASVFLKNCEPPGGWLGQSSSINFSHVNALNAVKLTNDYITQNHLQMNMFATMFFGVLDPTTGLLSYVNGGHEPLFILGDSGLKKTLKHTGPAVGMMPNMTFKIHQVYLDSGDILFSYTDGVTEGKNPAGQLFTTKRLLSLLEMPANSASELLERIKTDLFAYIDGAPQFDDITILVVRRGFLL